MWWQYLYGNLNPYDITGLSKKKLALLENSDEFINQMNYFSSLATNVFKWEGLPETCDERFIELSFLLKGMASFCEIDGVIINLLPANAAAYTLYGYSREFFGYGMNGAVFQFENVLESDSDIVRKSPAGASMAAKNRGVVGYDNIAAYPPIRYLIPYVKRLADCIRMCDIIAKSLKAPVIFEAPDDRTVNSFRELEGTINDNVFSIIKTKGLALEDIKTYDTGVSPERLKAVREHAEWVENRIRSFIGINSSEQNDKKERLLVDEINVNNQLTDNNIEKRFVYRKKFAGLVNKTFGLNVSVKVREDYENVEQEISEGFNNAYGFSLGNGARRAGKPVGQSDSGN